MSEDINTTIEPSQLKSNLDRHLRRNLIRKELNQKEQNLSEIRNKVYDYEYEKGENINKLSQDLLEGKNLADPRKLRILESFYGTIKGKYRYIPGLALVLLGSGAHGGSRARIAVENDTAESDIDLAVISDKPTIDPKILREITQKANTFFIAHARDYGLPEKTNICSLINPTVYWAKNLKNHIEAMKELSRLPYRGETSPVFLYFSPSIPSEINERNRSIVLETFRKLHQQNPEIWQETLDLFMNAWKRIHFLKSKHLAPFPRNWRDIALAFNTQEISTDLMSNAMREILEATSGLPPRKPNAITKVRRLLLRKMEEI